MHSPHSAAFMLTPSAVAAAAAAAAAPPLCAVCTDMYVFCCSYAHNVAAENKWLAFVSTTVETSSPEAELAPGLALLGPIDEKFVEVVDVHEPLEGGSRSGGRDGLTAAEKGGVLWCWVDSVGWGGVGWGFECILPLKLLCVVLSMCLKFALL